VHPKDFLVDMDVATTDQVAAPRTLEVVIDDGVQVFPAPDNTDQRANRLLIFTGTTVFEIDGDDDGDMTSGVVRVRLRYRMPKSLIFIGAATVAALASFHGSDDEDVLFVADAAETIVGPTANGELPDGGLPSDELYIIIDAAVLGGDSALHRIAYQANVLVRDMEPDLESILVRPAGSMAGFLPEIQLRPGDKWEFQITLTGPVVDPTFLIPLGSSDKNAAPIAAATQLMNGQISAAFFGGTVVGIVDEAVTLTAFGRRVSRTATLIIKSIK
jgi:hypothetical protein